ncbi:MAG TPA: gamma-glutamylcyclotransferase family protein [Thermoleophilaceae bacterium]
MLLFAYGSNMAAAEMSAYAPEARFIGPACLRGFRLEFRRRSIRRGGGAADVVQREGHEVWGVLYELASFESLDHKEAEGDSYRRREVELDAEGERITAFVYEVIDKEPEEVPPTHAYAELVRDGARERGLPAAWLDELERRIGEVGEPRPAEGPGHAVG